MTSSRESSHFTLYPSASSFRARMVVERISPKVTFSSCGAASRSAKMASILVCTWARWSPVNRRLTIAPWRFCMSSISFGVLESSASVHPLIAELTRITLPFNASASTMSSTLDIAVALATEDPPNFRTLYFTSQR